MKNYELIIPELWREGGEYDAINRGYFNGFQVKVHDQIHPVFFVTLFRIKHELEIHKERGGNYWAERNTIVIDAVTMPEIKKCLDDLEDGFFR